MKDGNSSRTVVAVTGLHRGESPQPGGAVVSSLRRRFPDLRVVGLCYDPMESGIYSQGGDRLDAIYLIPYPRAGARALMERLERVLADENLDLVIPCLDTEISNFIAIEKELNCRNVRVCLPTLQALEDRDKTNLGPLCTDLGLPAPSTAQAYDAGTLATHAATMGYPCYVKGQLYGARKASSVAEFYAAFSEIYNIWGGPVLVQEEISGEEYDLVGVGDGRGGIIGHCTIRKLFRTRLGKGFGGVVVNDPAIEEAAHRIIGRLKWNGPFELEFLKPPERPHMLFEMNPRFPAWVDFAAQIGCNLPACVLERAMGLQRSPLAQCEAGRMFIRHCTDLVTDIAEVASLGNHGFRSATSAEP